MARLLRRLLLLVALGALAGWLKQMLDRSDRLQQDPTPQASRSSQSSPSGGEPTKAELYERAQELGIKGRSKMSKAQLARAIQQAG